MQNRANILPISNPFAIDGVDVKYHHNNLIIGDTPEAIAKIHFVHSHLRMLNPLGRALADIIEQEIQLGNLLIIAKHAQVLQVTQTSQIHGFWWHLSGLENGKNVQLGLNCFKGKYIVLATDIKPELLVSHYVHETAHHWGSILGDSGFGDPFKTPQQQLQAIRAFFAAKHSLTDNILKMKLSPSEAQIATNFLIKLPLKNLQYDKNFSWDAHLKTFRSEFFAHHIQHAIICPEQIGLTPQTSEQLYRVIVESTRRSDLFTIANRINGYFRFVEDNDRALLGNVVRGVKPTLKDIVYPINVKLPYDYKTTSAAINLLSKNPQFLDFRGRLFAGLRNFKVDKQAVKGLWQVCDEAIDALLPKFKHIGERFRSLSLNKCVWPGMQILKLASHSYKEYLKHDGENWFNNGLASAIVEHVIYAPLLYSCPQSSVMFLASNLHEISVALQDHYRQQYLLLANKPNPTANDNALANILEKRANQAGICAGMTWLPNLLMRPVQNFAHNVGEVVQNELRDYHKDIQHHMETARAILPDDYERQQFLDDMQVAMSIPGADLIPLAARLGVKMIQHYNAENNKQVDVLRERPSLTPDQEDVINEIQAVWNGPIGLACNIIKDLPMMMKNFSNLVAPMAATPKNRLKMEAVGAAQIGAAAAAPKPQYPVVNYPVNVPFFKQSPKNSPAQQADTQVVPGAPAVKATHIEEAPKAPGAKFNLPAFNPALQREEYRLKPNETPPDSSPVANQHNAIPLTDTPPVTPNFQSGENSPASVPPVNTAPFELRNVKFNVEIGDKKAAIAAEFNFSNGTNAGVGLQYFGASGTLLVMGQLSVPLDCLTLANVLQAFQFVCPIVLICGAGIFIYQWREKRQMEKTVRHLKRHAIATEKEMQEYFGASFDTILTDKKAFNKFAHKLGKTINELAHRKKYALKHKDYGGYLYQVKNEQCAKAILGNAKQNKRDLNLMKKASNNVEKEYGLLSLEELIDKFKEQTKDRVLTKDSAISTAALRDYIIKRILAENKYELLSDNPALLAEDICQYYNLPNVKFPPMLNKHAIVSKGNYRHKSYLPEVIEAKLTKLEEAYNNYKKAITSGAKAETIEAAAKEFFECYDDCKNEFSKMKMKSNAFQYKTVFDYYADFMKTMYNTVRDTSRDLLKGGIKDNKHLTHFGSRYDLTQIDLMLKTFEEHKDKKIHELFVLAKSAAKDKGVLSKAESTQYSALIQLLYVNALRFAHQGNFSVVRGLVRDVKKDLAAQKDESEKPLVDVKQWQELESCVNYMEENSDKDANFWLDELQNEIDKEAKKKDKNKDKSKDSNTSEGKSLRHELIAIELVNKANKCSELGYFKKSADLLKELQKKDPDLDLNDHIKQSEFSHRGQIFDTFMKPLQSAFEHYIDGLEASRGKALAKGAISAVNCAQLLVPNLMILPIHGAYCFLLDDLAAFNKAFGDLKVKAWKDIASPCHSFSSVILYANMSNKILQAIPFERLAPVSWRPMMKQARYVIVSASGHGIKLGQIGNAVFQLQQYGLAHATYPAHLASVLNGVVEYGFAFYNLYLKRCGKANENPKYYLTEQGIKSGTDLVASAKFLSLIIPGGAGLLAAIGIGAVQGAVGLYKLNSKAGRQAAAGKALLGALHNIYFNSSKLGEKDANRNSLLTMVDKSNKNILRILNQYFGGVRYNPKELTEANESRVSHFTQMVKLNFEHRKFIETIAETTKYFDAKNIFINERYRIPSFLAWQAILFRLRAFAECDQQLMQFNANYSEYSQYIYNNAPKALVSELNGKLRIKEALQAIVSFAINRYLAKAYAKDTLVVNKIKYLQAIIHNFDFCKPWHEILSSEQLFLAAVIAFGCEDEQTCRLFLSKINLAQFMRSDIVGKLSELELLMLNRCARSNYQALLQDNSPARLTDDHLTKLGRELIAVHQYQDALNFENLPRNFPGKYLIAAKGQYYLGNHGNLDKVFTLLFKESTQDDNYWFFFSELIEQMFLGESFIKNIARHNDVFVKLSCLQWVATKYLQRNVSAPEALQSFARVIQHVQTNLRQYVRMSAPSTPVLTDEQVDQRVANLLGYWDRVILERSETNLRSEMENILSASAYQLRGDNSPTRYLPYPASNQDNSVFTLFGEKREKCIERLTQTMNQQIWNPNWLNRDLNSKTLMHWLFDFAEQVTGRQLTRSAANLGEEKQVIIRCFETQNITPQAGKYLLAALAILNNRHAHLYQGEVDGTLINIQSLTTDNANGSIYVICNETHYATLVPITVRAFEIHDELPEPIHAPNAHELAVAAERQAPAANVAVQPRVITTADEHLAHGCQCLRMNDVSNAGRHFESALRANPNHTGSLYQIGLLYKARSENQQALERFKQAADAGHYPSKEEWLWLKHKDLNDSAAWLRLGNNYHLGSDQPRVEKDLEYAYAAYLRVKQFTPHTQAVAGDALYKLALLIESGKRLEGNVNYQNLYDSYINQAAALGHERAKLNKLHAANQGLNSAAWVALGRNYKNGTGIAVDHFLAQACFEKAEAGNDLSGCKELMPFIHRVATAEDWYRLGQDYNAGQNQLRQNYLRAQACFELALGLTENHIPSLMALGRLLENITRTEQAVLKALEYYRKAANLNDSTARVAYIKLKWQRENSFPQDILSTRSVDEWFSVANDLYLSCPDAALFCYQELLRVKVDHAEALYKVGCLLELKSQFILAAKHYQQAASKGHAQGSVKLSVLATRTDLCGDTLNGIGVLYHNADGIDRNYGEASKWYKLAITKQNAYAYFNTGILYEYGCIENKKDLLQAIKNYQLAIDKGYISANAKNNIDRVANHADMTAELQNLVGLMYYCGTDVRCNYIEARSWFTLAANRNNGAALRNLGFMLEQGIEAVVDKVKAAQYYQRAIVKGFDNAKNDLNRLLAMSALNANPGLDGSTINSIGVLYHNADGIPRDYVEASKWYQLAIAKRDGFACFNLGLLYKNGCIGSHPNLAEAIKYFELAIANGYPEDKANAEVARCTPQTVVRAQRKQQGGAARFFQQVLQLPGKIVYETERQFLNKH